MSKNSLGLRTEIKVSIKFHQSGIAVLVSPSLLRTRDLGQVDLARLCRIKGDWCLEVAEVKSSHVGILVMESFQKKRLFHAQRFLAGIFGVQTRYTNIVR